MKARTIPTLLLLPLLTPALSRTALPQIAAPQHAARAAGGYALDPTVRDRARYLAASTADEALKWSDRQAAVRVVSGAADLLWDEDPRRAGAWLTSAWELAGQVAVPGDGGASQRYRSVSHRSQARAAVLAAARRHDKALADHFLHQLDDGQEQEEGEGRRGVFDDRTARSEQLLNLALAMVDENLGEAANLAERSLADGISFQLQRVLLEVRERDSAAADRVFDSALARMAGGLPDAREAQVLASYLFTPGRVFSVGGDRTVSLAVRARNPVAGLTPAEADPARARRFLGVVQRVVLSLPAPSSSSDPSLRAQELVTLALSLRGGFERYAPDLWLPVGHRLANVMPDLGAGRPAGGPSQAMRERMQSADLPAGGDAANSVYVDALEAAAGRETSPVARKLAYAQAALASAPEDLARGVKIASKIGEDGLRKQVISFLVYRAALSSLEKGQLDEAVELASGAEPLQRAVVLITAAQRLAARRAGKGDEQVAAQSRQRALELLSEAHRSLKGEGRPCDLLRARLGHVAALTHFDARGALDYLKDVVADINRADSFDIVEAGAPPVAGMSGLSLHASVPAIRDGYGLKDVFVLLAREDFDESIYVAGKLTAPTARGICMLEIARSVLAGDAPAKLPAEAPAKLPAAESAPLKLPADAPAPLR